MDIKIDVEAKVKDKTFNLEVSARGDDMIVEEIYEQILDQFEDEDGNIEIEIDDIEFRVTNWGELYGYSSLQDRLDDLYYYEGHTNDLDVLEAAMDAGIDFDDVDDSYQGEYSSDEEFTEQLLNDCGDIRNLPSYVIIDWDATARGIMQDYTEYNGHYFRY